MVAAEKLTGRPFKTAIFMRPDEKDVLERAAHIEDRSLPDFVRHVAVKAATAVLEREESGR